MEIVKIVTRIRSQAPMIRKTKYVQRQRGLVLYWNEKELCIWLNKIRLKTPLGVSVVGSN